MRSPDLFYLKQLNFFHKKHPFVKVENASTIDLRWNNGMTSESDPPSNAMLTTAKWCPLENCTVLVLGESKHADRNLVLTSNEANPRSNPSQNKQYLMY